MEDPVHVYRVVKLAVGGIASLVLGIGLILTGELQSIVAGSGVLLASVLIFGFLGWAFASNKGTVAHPEEGQPPEAESQVRVVWLGIALTLLSGLMYFYLRYAMTGFDPMTICFVNGPLLIAGLGCIGVALGSAIKSKASAGRPHEGKPGPPA